MGIGPAGVPPMLRTCSCVIAVTAMLIALPTTVQGAEAVLTLACQGTTQRVYGGGRRADPEPISMGVIVNFTAGTVTGFTDPFGWDFQPKIVTTNNTNIIISLQ